MKKRPLILSTVVLAVATSANAQLITLNDNIDLFVTGTLAATYESNVLKDANAGNVVDDVYFSIIPGLQLVTRSGTSNLSLNAWIAEEIKRYCDNSDFNDENLKAGLGLSYDNFGKTMMDFKASYIQYDNQGTEDSLRYQEKQDRDVTTLSFYGRQYVLPKVSLGLGADYIDTNYDGHYDQYDRYAWGIPVNLYYNLTELYAISLGYRYSNEHASADWAEQNSQSHFLNIGIDAALSAKVSGYARVGYTRYSSIFDETSNGLGWDVGLNYAATQLTSFFVKASGDFGLIADSQSARRILSTIGMNHKITPSVTANLRLSCDQYDYLDVIRSDTAFFGYVGATWSPINQIWSVSGGYQYQMNDSNASLQSYHNNMVTLGASVRF